MAAPKLKDLHKALIATLAGYREAAEKTESAPVKMLCQDVIEFRTEHHEELHRLLRAAGEEVDDAPTLMSKVQETVIDARAAITGVNENALPSFIRGEKQIIEKYDAAIEEGSSQTSAATLRAQKATVENAVTKMEALEPK